MLFGVPRQGHWARARTSRQSGVGCGGHGSVWGRGGVNECARVSVREPLLPPGASRVPMSVCEE